MSPGRRESVATSVIAAVWLACLSPGSSAWAQSSAYQAIVDQYRSGHTDAAVAALIGWSRARVASEARPGKLPKDEGLRQAAAALHTEVAIRHPSVPLSVVHFQIAFGGVASLGVGARTKAFRQAWYVAAISHLVRWGALRWAGALVGRIPPDVADTPEAHAVAGLYHEMAAEASPTARSGVRELTAAEGDYRAAVSARPDLVQTRLRLGRVLVQLDRAGEGMAEFDRVSAETLDPTLNYLVRLFLGEAHERAGDFDAALSCYRTAAELSPDGLAANLSLGRMLLMTGRRPEAADLAMRMLNPDGSEGFNPEHDPWEMYRRGFVSPFGLELASMQKAVRR